MLIFSGGYPFFGDQTMQINGDFEGFLLSLCIGWVGNIMTPVNPDPISDEWGYFSPLPLMATRNPARKPPGKV